MPHINPKPAILLNFLVSTTALVALSGAGAAFGAAPVLPTGGQVVAGSASIGKASGSSLTITQTSSSAVIDWTSFSIGQGGVVNIVQPGAQSVQLDRVTGGTLSSLAGQLNATGSVYLINPNGIVITKSGAITAGGGFVASTLDMDDQAFMGGSRSLRRGSGPSSASVSNAGMITIGRGGYAALLSGSVDNAGSILVSAGKVALGSGDAATLDLSGDGFLQVALSDGAGSSSVASSGLIQAKGGQVILSAASALAAARGVVNLSGTVQAQAITVTGSSIRLTGAQLDASQDGQGGTIRIGGGAHGTGDLAQADTVTMDAGSVLKADATGSVGDGGSVSIWSTTATDFAGTITARGGSASGNGGSAEVSSAGSLTLAGTADLTAANGRTGTFLLDPYDLTVDQTAATAINTSLATANVTLQTTDAGASGSGVQNASGSGDITIAAPISWSSASTLTLNAYRNIYINANISSSGSGGLDLEATAQTGLSRTGLSFGAGGSVTFGGLGQIDGQRLTIDLVPYRLVYSLSQLDAADGINAVTGAAVPLYGGGVTGAYALAGDLDGTGQTFTQPLLGSTSKFLGNLEGLGHTLSNITIAAPEMDDVGLIGQIGHSFVADLNLVNITVTGRNTVGALAGLADYTYLSNITATGQVIATGSGAGGLAGSNAGVIQTVMTNVAVSAASDAGGLVGDNIVNGQILNAVATGPVFANDTFGGLVGANHKGVIETSYATGAVVANPGASPTAMGGLIGLNDGIVAGAVFDVSTSGQSSGVGHEVADPGSPFVGSVTGLTTAQLQGLAASGNISLATILGSAFGGGSGGLYPYLTALFPNGVQAVSGSVHADGGATLLAPSGSASGLVTLDAQGASPGFGRAGANGYYYVALPAGTLAAGQSYAVYTSSGRGALTLAASSGAQTMSGIDLLGDALGVNTSATSLSATLSPTSARALASSIIGSDASAASVLNGLADYALITTAPAFVIDQPLTVSGDLILEAAGSVTQSAPISASGLVLNTMSPAAGAPAPPAAAFTLNLAGNQITALSGGAVGEVTVSTDTSLTLGLTLGSLDGFAGLVSPAGSVTLQAGQDLTLASPLSLQGNSGLTLSAGHSLYILTPVTLSGGGAVTLQYNDVALQGGVTPATPATPATPGVLSFGLGSWGFKGQISFAPDPLTGTAQSGQSLSINGTHYTLLYKLADLTLIDGQGDGGAYALATSPDATGQTFTGSLVGGGSSGLTGTFEGLGHTITGLAITTGSGPGPLTGLFGAIGQGGRVSDLGLAGASLSTGGQGGLIASYSAGTVSQVFVSGQISTTSATDAIGGVVGWNDGRLDSIIAQTTVTGLQTVGGVTGVLNGGSLSNITWTGSVMDNAGGAYTGGITGYAAQNTAIATVTASGTVASTGLFTGAVAGYLAGSLNGAAISGSVSGTSFVGGAVAYSTGTISAANSSASVTGAYATGGLVGWNIGTVATSSLGANSGGATSSNTGPSVIGSDSYTGGLVGFNAGTLNSDTVLAASVTGVSYTGGLAGYNQSSITQSSAAATVTGSVSFTGGLVGSSAGTISMSSATGSVTGGVWTGGLAGANELAGTITTSSASGSVTATLGAGGLVGLNDGYITTSSAGAPAGQPPSQIMASQFAGGIVGVNDQAGTISSSLAGNQTILAPVYGAGGFAGASNGSLSLISASGQVSGGNAIGGLVGTNGGSLLGGSATGSVTGYDQIGGLVGANTGVIDQGADGSATTASGAVSGHYAIGGLVGDNTGSINHVSATGAVMATTAAASGDTPAFAGGIVGVNEAGGVVSSATRNSQSGISATYGAGGLAGLNQGQITNSTASDQVMTGDKGGGIAGMNLGALTGDTSSSLVNASTDGGGVAGYNGQYGVISLSAFTGQVSLGSGGYWAGGLVGYNDGTVQTSWSSGSVSGASQLGGVAGFNSSFGLIGDVYATGPVTGTSIVGGLVGHNQGTLQRAYASGPVTATGSPAYAGGVTGWNDASASPAPILANIYWDPVTTGQATGSGAGSSTGAATIPVSSGNLQASYAGFDFVNTWTIVPGASRPTLTNNSQTPPPH